MKLQEETMNKKFVFVLIVVGSLLTMAPTIYLPYISGPVWKPTFITVPVDGQMVPQQFSWEYRPEYNMWILEHENGGLWEIAHTCTLDPMTCNASYELMSYVMDLQVLGFGTHTLRVHGEGNGEITDYDYVTITLFWQPTTWDLRFDGDNDGGTLIVRHPSHTGLWLHIWIDPNTCVVTSPPPGSVWHQDMWVVNLPSGTDTTSFQWIQTGDCWMYIRSAVGTDVNLLWDVDTNYIFTKQWPKP